VTTISDSIRIALAKAKKKQSDLGAHWFTTRQVVSNKFYRDYWSANELADIAKFAGCKLIFKFPDGTEIAVETDEAPRLSVEKAMNK